MQVYKAFLEELQFYGVLAVADVQKIFANLSELVEVSLLYISTSYLLTCSLSLTSSASVLPLTCLNCLLVVMEI